MAWNADPAGDALTQILHPLTVDEFLGTYWGKQELVIDGPSDKFAGLMTWEDLNRVVESDLLRPLAHMLGHRGETLPRSRFVRTNKAGAENGVDAAAIRSCLAKGATLIANGVDGVVPAVGSVASSLEETFGTTVFVNLYGAFGEDNGFDTHRDPQDVIIVQVEGRKRWSLFAPTRDHPREQDVGQPPRTEPYWEGVLEPGQTLYLPRGWWHVAHALNGPSLHLTVTIVPPTGEDFLTWLVDRRAESDATVRANLPILGYQDLGAARTLGHGLLDDVSENDVQEFLANWKSQLPSRPVLGLSSGWSTESSDLGPDSCFRMALTRGFARQPATGGFAPGTADDARSTRNEGRRYHFVR